MGNLIIDQSLEIRRKNREKKNESKEKRKNDFLVLEKSFNIGYYLITPIGLGVIFGLFLDRYFNKDGFFIIIFLIIGAIGSFYNLFRLTKSK